MFNPPHEPPHDPTLDRSRTHGAGRRRTIAAGVGGGLLAGTAIGLVMVAPSFTNAATDQSPADDVAAVALQDDTVAPTDTGDTTDTTEPGEALRGLLQELVDAGTITAEQADAVTDHLVANRPERPERGDGGARHGRRPGWDGEVVAELLGIDAAEFREQLRAGSSIADIAAENGVDVQIVIDALVAEASSHLDLSVESGRLTQEEADERLVELTDRITERVNGPRD